MLRVRFYVATTGTTRFEATAKGGDVDFKISQTPSFTVEVLRSQINADLINAGGIAADVYYNGTFLIGGMCQRVEVGGNDPTVTIACRQWIDNLYDERSYTQASYKDQAILIILGELLRREGWRIGDISTVVDKNEVTTIDLRQAERLLPQITKLMDNSPELFYRYGGFQAGKHMLDVGLFGSSSGKLLLTPSEEPAPHGNLGLINTLARDVVQTDVIRDLEMVGGEIVVSATVTRNINLGDALLATPALATDPFFPILVDIPNFVWKIRNMAVPDTLPVGQTTQLSEYAPEKTGTVVLLADIKSAGLALYRAGVNILKLSGQIVDSLTITAEGTIDLMPRLGDTMYVRGRYVHMDYDPTLEIATEVIRLVEGNYRVNSIHAAIKSDDLVWSFGLSIGTAPSETDSTVALYKKTAPTLPPAGSVYVPAYKPTMVSIVHVVSDGVSDATLSDGTLAKRVSLSLPTAPVGATDVYLCGLPYGTSPFGTIRVELVSDPVFGGAGPIYKIAISGRWLPSFSANMEQRIVWI